MFFPIIWQNKCKAHPTSHIVVQVARDNEHLSRKHGTLSPARFYRVLRHACQPCATQFLVSLVEVCCGAPRKRARLAHAALAVFTITVLAAEMGGSMV